MVNLRRLKIIWTILLLLAVVSLSGMAFFMYKYYQLKNSGGQSSKKEIQVLVDEISKLIILPTDEEPTVYTVSDPAALKDQPFFAHAKRGDKVLIYSKARKIILFDPVANKVVDVAPLNINESGEGLMQ